MIRWNKQSPDVRSGWAFVDRRNFFCLSIPRLSSREFQWIPTSIDDFIWNHVQKKLFSNGFIRGNADGVLVKLWMKKVFILHFEFWGFIHVSNGLASEWTQFEQELNKEHVEMSFSWSRDRGLLPHVDWNSLNFLSNLSLSFSFSLSPSLPLFRSLKDILTLSTISTFSRLFRLDSRCTRAHWHSLKRRCSG